MQFNPEQCKSTTLTYYENWLGEMGCLASGKGNQQIFSTERNAVQAGYPNRMDLYIWVEPSRTIISYGDAVKSKMPMLAEKLLGLSVFGMLETLNGIFDNKPKHNEKYFYQGYPAIEQTEITAKTLTLADYVDFEAFHASCFPGSGGDWLYEYFEDMVRYNYCAGVYIDGLLVSCTDAPTMPYMPEQMQEIGISTIESYRGRGYATVACRKAADNIIQGGRYPTWLNNYTNIGSRRTAENTGFAKLADVLTLTL